MGGAVEDALSQTLAVIVDGLEAGLLRTCEEIVRQMQTGFSLTDSVRVGDDLSHK